jgi:hypothetical protein
MEGNARGYAASARSGAGLRSPGVAAPGGANTPGRSRGVEGRRKSARREVITAALAKQGLRSVGGAAVRAGLGCATTEPWGRPRSGRCGRCGAFDRSQARRWQVERVAAPGPATGPPPATSPAALALPVALATIGAPQVSQ